MSPAPLNCTTSISAESYMLGPGIESTETHVTKQSPIAVVRCAFNIIVANPVKHVQRRKAVDFLKIAFERQICLLRAMRK